MPSINKFGEITICSSNMLFAQEEEEGPFTCLPTQWVGGNGGGGEVQPDPEPDPNPSPCSADDPGCTNAPDPTFTNPGSDEGLDPDDYEWWEWFDVDPMEIDDYDSYDEYMDAQNGNGDPNNSHSYSITINDDVTHYTNEQSVHILESKSNLRLRIHDASSNFFDPRIFHWKKNKSDPYDCSAVDTCNSIPGTATSSANGTGKWNIQVDNEFQKRQIFIKLFIHKRPTLYFTTNKNYHGEYGFDDSAHKYLKDSIRFNKAYPIVKLNHDTAYEVPWMSLISGDTATVGLRKNWNKDSISVAQNRNDRVFISGSNSKIKINGLSQYIVDLKDLNALDSLKITATQWDVNTHTNKSFGSISAITSSGDTIGRLNISCATPIEKKAVIVFVNTGSGYRNITRQNIIDSLNKFSHNQLFRKWTLYQPEPSLFASFDSSTVMGMDTVNLANEFNLYNTLFHDEDSLMSQLPKYYENHKNGLSMQFDVNKGTTHTMGNSLDKVHFIFIFNYKLPTISGSNTLGLTMKPGYISMLWNNAFYQDFAHELGHILNLNHIFPEWNKKNTIFFPRFNIPMGRTKNYMDYAAPGKIDLTNMFYFAQWVTVF